MKNRLKLLVWLFALSGPLAAQSVSVNGPDGKLQLTVSCPSANGEVSYAVTYNGKQMLESSPLGMETNVGDFYRGLQLKEHKVTAFDTVYEQSRIKASHIHYRANELLCSFVNGEGKNVQITFRVSNNDVAFRYTLPREQGKGSVTVNSERTGFRFPSQTTTFLCPQSDAMIGWKRTKPSYEEEYKADAPMNERSGYGHGYTFPCLFKVGDDGWVLLSETGVDSRYCGSRLSDWDNGVYRIAFPMPEENNGNGTVSPAFSLPGSTPWRTVTVGETLKPIVETTVPWDVVEPRYTTTHDYKPGRGTWSWILWQDGSINYDDQVRYVDLAAAMGYEYVLIDNWWDNNIGRDRMEQFIKYARSKGVEVFLWYSSSGYWNDIEQSPVNRMDNSIARKQEMRWLQSLGVKGIKVDFFGGDKQETLRLYEEILSDADDHGLMVIFHGCTLLSEILRQLRQTHADTKMSFRIGGKELRRWGVNLVMVDPVTTPRGAELLMPIEWKGEECVVLAPWSGILKFVRCQGDEPGLDANLLREGKIEVRPRRGGEKIKLYRLRPSRNLKHLFQSVGVPSFERSKLPLIWINDRLVFAAGLGTDVRMYADPVLCPERVRLVWVPDKPLLALGPADDDL